MANISKWSPEKEEAILTALRAKPTFEAACRAVRITRTTLNRWRKENPEFEARVQAAREEGFDRVEDCLVERAIEGDTTAAIFMLKSWRRSRYGDKIAHEHAGSLNLNHRDASAFTDAEIEALAAIAERRKAGELAS
jgi:hypothetical protein